MCIPQAAVSVVILVEPRSIPKTTSGKIQRHKCKNGYKDGTLREVYRWEAASSADGCPLTVNTGLEAEETAQSEASFVTADMAFITPMSIEQAKGCVDNKEQQHEAPPQEQLSGPADDIVLEGLADGSPEKKHETSEQKSTSKIQMTVDHSPSLSIPVHEVEERTAYFIDQLVTYVVKARGLKRETIDINQPMSCFGFDSLGFVALGRTMGDWVGKEIPPAIVYKFTTIKEVAGFLARGAREEELALDDMQDDNLPPDLQSPIAIVGIGCRAPGGPKVGNLIGREALWKFIVEGNTAVREDMPTERKIDRSLKIPGNYLDGIDQFDNEFFDFGLTEAAHMDYHQVSASYTL